MIDFYNPACCHELMKSNLRISIKDFRRNETQCEFLDRLVAA
jgi:hypothetical protein